MQGELMSIKKVGSAGASGDMCLVTPLSKKRESSINTTNEVLKAGYIVEVYDYDHNNEIYLTRKPTSDDLPNIAVVKTEEVGTGEEYELQFTGAVTLWYTGTAPTVVDTLGSKSGTFEAKIGSTGFAPVETGGSGRCRSRFFNLKTIAPVQVTGEFLYVTGVSTTVSPAGYVGYASDSKNLSTKIRFKKRKLYLFVSSISGHPLIVSGISGTSSSGNFVFNLVIEFLDSDDTVVASGFLLPNTEVANAQSTAVYSNPGLRSFSVKSRFDEDGEATKYRLRFSGSMFSQNSPFNITQLSFYWQYLYMIEAVTYNDTVFP